MGLLCLIYLVAALRINVVFVVIFATLVVAFGVLAGAYWQLAQANAAQGSQLLVVSSQHIQVLYPISRVLTDPSRWLGLSPSSLV